MIQQMLISKFFCFFCKFKIWNEIRYWPMHLGLSFNIHELLVPFSLSMVVMGSKLPMMTSNENIFHLYWPFDWWIPCTKASDVELWCFSLICTWINGWVNNREAGDLRCHCTRYDVTVMPETMNEWVTPAPDTVSKTECAASSPTHYCWIKGAHHIKFVRTHISEYWSNVSC